MIPLPNTKNRRRAFIFAGVLSMLFLLLLSSCAPDRKAVFGKAIGDSCTSDTDCHTMDCINLECTDVLNEIEAVLQDSDLPSQKIRNLASILRSYFSLG